ncbi:hypothetical protein [Pontibacillus litoralis]|uniref:Uncharacterized protein n=1 Tax=Pontibacillus litoralis JSM 072002 TaxID=1385512 RepID=A0A0A5GB12_9BACI|nr:hypothetical protein [Pontibacillus litoralis]KGX89224.1 hypothetical protein N784_02340 [Pontibacillus litoralis JSM 072002]
MTSEIVVMNTGGIALAADRAVTVGKEKASYLVDKIFGFSGNHAIGAMTYGSGGMFHVPWKTLIHLYEQQLEGPLDTLEDYALDFIRFLNEHACKEYLTDIHEVRHLENVMFHKLNQLYEDLSELHQETHHQNSRIRSPEEIQDLYKEKAKAFLHKSMQELQEKDYQEQLNNEDEEMLFEEYGHQAESWIAEKFEKYLYEEEWTETMKTILILTLIKDFSHLLSGIIFAGYGRQDIFPSVHLLIIDGKVNGKTKFFTRQYKVHQDRRALIIPFAQRDMAKAVMNGIHEELEEQLSADLLKDFKNITKVMIPRIKEYVREDEVRDAIKKEVDSALRFIFKRYEENLVKLKREKFSEPLLHSIKTLPAKELAAVAESLVHIAAFKGNESVTMETAKHSADVAIITKDGGFSWKKRG